MTDHDLRSLLRDQVADVTTTADLSADVWHTSRGARRRRTIGVVAGAAAATVLVFGGIAILDSQPKDQSGPSPAPATDNPTPDGRFRGASVYWSPSQPEEAALPLMSSDRPPLPEVIDLSAEATPVEVDPIDRAVAAFGVVGDGDDARLLLLAPDGTYRSLDLSEVGPDPTVSCCERPPLRDTMLSPSGEYLMFPQVDSVLVYDLPRREWRTIETGGADTTLANWFQGDRLVVPPSPHGMGPFYNVVTGRQLGVGGFPITGQDLKLDQQQSYKFGPASNGLQSWGSGAELPVPTGTPNKPELLVMTGDETLILTFTGSPGGDDRWLQCCPVVGWAADDVAMYESRSGTPQIIAWTVGTHRFETVSTITGFTPGEQSYVGSYADLWR
jgi:hypothetical protein